MFKDKWNDVPFGYCQCGCGQRTEICRWPHPERGHFKGQPLPFVRFHKKRKYPLKPTYIVDENGCWNWQGFITTKGYGLHHENNETTQAHRYMYETLKEPIPEGLLLDHICRNRKCVNPNHLRPATLSQNSANSVKPVNPSRPPTSRFKGVTKPKGSKRWKAHICLGSFGTEKEAAEAYNKAASALHGEFAMLNQIH